MAEFVEIKAEAPMSGKQIIQMLNEVSEAVGFAAKQCVDHGDSVFQTHENKEAEDSRGDWQSAADQLTATIALVTASRDRAKEALVKEFKADLDG